MEAALHHPAGERQRRPLTAFLWILIGYFCVDAVVRGAQVADLLTASEELNRTILLKCAFQILFSVLELLITLQIFVRTIAARIFGTGLLGVHLFYSSYSLAVRNPDSWLMLDNEARFAFLGHVVFLSVAIILLNRRPCRMVLCQ
ncbi:MAG: hypothetical protein AAF581_11985 [Planctomycetota bacterium]